MIVDKLGDIYIIAGGDIPEERGDDEFSDDVDETESQLGRDVANELGGQGAVIPTLPPSPVAKRREVGPGAKKRKEAPGLEKEKEKVKKAKTITKTNSEMFPANVRPEMFRDDDMFNKLGFEKASTFVHEHALLQAKMKMKESTKSGQEKSDDEIKKVKIPAGEDDARETLNIEARKALRPVNKEISEQMSWIVTKWDQVVRNLPLDIYGLADSVPTKAIELAHNLASHLTIDMFCPGGKKNNTVKQKALKSKDGELAVETMDVYSDLDSIQDVQIAWNTLQAIWQKVFPEWPVAVIGQRVIMNMKNFSHCGHEAKEVMVRFSNRFLTSNSQSAARRKKPLSYERAWNLAGSVCMELGYNKEPPATKGIRVTGAGLTLGGQGGGQGGGLKGVQRGGQVSNGGSRGAFRGGRGGSVPR